MLCPLETFPLSIQASVGVYKSPYSLNGQLPVRIDDSCLVSFSGKSFLASLLSAILLRILEHPPLCFIFRFYHGINYSVSSQYREILKAETMPWLMLNF